MLLRSPFRLRYSLRALFVFMAFFCLWGGYHANRGWKERKAQKQLVENADASFEYLHQRKPRTRLEAIRGTYECLVAFLWRDRPITRASIGSNLEPAIVDALQSLRVWDIETFGQVKLTQPARLSSSM